MAESIWHVWFGNYYRCDKQKSLFSSYNIGDLHVVKSVSQKDVVLIISKRLDYHPATKKSDNNTKSKAR